MTSKQKWLIMAPMGLVLTGLGLCLFGEALTLKQSGAPTLTWITWGTLSLVVFNSGLSVFGGAIIQQVRHIQQKSK